LKKLKKVHKCVYELNTSYLYMWCHQTIGLVYVECTACSYAIRSYYSAEDELFLHLTIQNELTTTKKHLFAVNNELLALKEEVSAITKVCQEKILHMGFVRNLRLLKNYTNS